MPAKNTGNKQNNCIEALFGKASLHIKKVGTDMLIFAAIAFFVLMLIAFSHNHLHLHAQAAVELIDYYAQVSGLSKISSAFKIIFFVALLLFCIAANSAIISVIIILSMLLLTVYVGKIPLNFYLRLLFLPVMFIVLSCLAIVFN
ncbi:MAG TPA: hypothetical protein DCP97_04105, partial [Ruminococcaceae bacterium]|nr:hypothetical protein [Oscillospiraceae bacterium]